MHRLKQLSGDQQAISEHAQALPALWEVTENEEVASRYLTGSPFPTDVNECLHSELQACSEGKQCRNLEGSYQCVSPQQLTTLPSQHLNHTDKGNARGLRQRGRDRDRA